VWLENVTEDPRRLPCFSLNKFLCLQHSHKTIGPVSRNTCPNCLHLSVWSSVTWSALQVAKLFADAGIIALVSFISPYRADRDAVRARLPPGRFVEVYMKVRENGFQGGGVTLALAQYWLHK
jgi:hypothetical protein